MAGLEGAPVQSPSTRGQYAAIATVRKQLLLNSLRSSQGQFELGARIAGGLLYGFIGLGLAVGLGAGAYAFLHHHHPEMIAFLLWPVFLLWQLMPIMLTSFAGDFEISGLLRFPLSYRSYFFVRLLYGLLDIPTMMGLLSVIGIGCGILIARPALFPFAALVLAAYALFNILLSRTIFVWIERWLAQRRTRELMAVIFFLFLLSLQLITPLTQRFTGKPSPAFFQSAKLALPLERLTPPGIAAVAIGNAAHHQLLPALGYFTLFVVYIAAFAALLNVRMRAQYRGENLSESSVPTAKQIAQPIRAETSLPFFGGPLGTLFLKDLRYLLRSGPALFTLITPLFLLVVLSANRYGPLSGHSAAYRFPVGAAYTLLVLVNLIYNSFGPDGTGIQFYFAAPVPIRTVLAAKNLIHTSIMVIQIVLAWLLVSLLFRMPAPDLTCATFAWMLFAVPLNLAVGNVMSIISPRKFDFGKFGRQKGASTNAFASLGVQAVTAGLGAMVLLYCTHLHNLWLATPIFATLGAVSFVIYFRVLAHVDKLANDRRDTLIAELCKAT